MHNLYRYIPLVYMPYCTQVCRSTYVLVFLQCTGTCPKMKCFSPSIIIHSKNPCRNPCGLELEFDLNSGRIMANVLPDLLAGGELQFAVRFGEFGSRLILGELDLLSSEGGQAELGKEFLLSWHGVFQKVCRERMTGPRSENYLYIYI